ncbi:hypothetical protein IAT38_002116 [Cryptococcus sp. DSM 104549]
MAPSTPSDHSDTDLTQRTALVTGCSSPEGIGAHTAEALAERGYRVFATARAAKDLAHLSGKCEPIVLDVTSAESIRAAVETVNESTHGRLDVLVNNAGIDSTCPALDTSIPAFRTILETNLIAPLAITQAFASLLIKAGNEPAEEGGKVRRSVVLNVGSIVVWGPAWKAAYNASKAGLEVMSDTMRIEMENLGVHVITCETGAVNTSLFNNGKSFPAASPTPSGYYPNYPAISEKISSDVASRAIASAEQVGNDIASAIDKPEPAGRILVGSFARPLAAVVPVLRWVGLKDWFWRSQNYTWMVERPQATKNN